MLCVPLPLGKWHSWTAFGTWSLQFYMTLRNPQSETRLAYTTFRILLLPRCMTRVFAYSHFTLYLKSHIPTYSLLNCTSSHSTRFSVFTNNLVSLKTLLSFIISTLTLEHKSNQWLCSACSCITMATKQPYCRLFVLVLVLVVFAIGCSCTSVGHTVSTNEEGCDYEELKVKAKEAQDKAAEKAKRLKI